MESTSTNGQTDNSNRSILPILVIFGIYFVLDQMYFSSLRQWIFQYVPQIGAAHILAYLASCLTLFIGLLWLHGKHSFFESLGLSRSFRRAVLFAFLCTLPMFVGYAVVSNFTIGLTVDGFLISVLAAAFFEELIFRGFFFGQLFRYTKLGFITSVILNALIFGLLHLYQGTEWQEILGIFLVTFSGGVLFAWAYVEWDFNLWVPIFLHFFMNLSWDLFNISDDALGTVYGNLFRILTIALIIFLTLVYKRRKGLSLAVQRHNLWVKPTA